MSSLELRGVLVSESELLWKDLNYVVVFGQSGNLAEVDDIESDE